jgi:hypothetical protein
LDFEAFLISDFQIIEVQLIQEMLKEVLEAEGI